MGRQTDNDARKLIEQNKNIPLGTEQRPVNIAANVIVGFMCPPDAGATAYIKVAIRTRLEMPMYAPTCGVP